MLCDRLAIATRHFVPCRAFRDAWEYCGSLAMGVCVSPKENNATRISRLRCSGRFRSVAFHRLQVAGFGVRLKVEGLEYRGLTHRPLGSSFMVYI